MELLMDPRQEGVPGIGSPANGKHAAEALLRELAVRSEPRLSGIARSCSSSSVGKSSERTNGVGSRSLIFGRNGAEALPRILPPSFLRFFCVHLSKNFRSFSTAFCQLMWEGFMCSLTIVATVQPGSVYAHAECFSSKYSGFSTADLLVSTMHPSSTISSRITCAFSRLNMMSNSHTFSKYLSNVSTSV